LKQQSRKNASIIRASLSYSRQIVLIFRGLVLLPIYINQLGGELYGLWVASGGVLELFNILDLGLGRMISQRVAFYYGKKDSDNAVLYFINGSLLFLPIGIILALVGYFIAPFITHVINTPANHFETVKVCFQLSTIFIFFRMLNLGITSGIHALLRPKIPGFALVSSHILGIISTIYFIYNDFGLYSIPLGYILQTSTVLLINISYTFHLLRKIGSKIKVNFKVIREYFHFSSYLILGKIGKGMVQRIEPTVISMMINPTIAAGYTVTRRAVDFIRQFLVITLNSSFTSLSHLIGEGKLKRAENVVSYFLNFLLFVGLLLFSSYIILNESFVKLWVDESNYLGITLTVLLAFAFWSMSAHTYVYNLILAFGKFKKASLIILFEALFRIGFMFLFVKLFDINGIPIAIIFTTLVSFLIMFMQLREIFKKEKNIITLFSYKRLLLLIFIIVAAVSLNFVISQYINSWLPFVCFSIVSLLVLSLTLYFGDKIPRSIFNILIDEVKNKINK